MKPRPTLSLSRISIKNKSLKKPHLEGRKTCFLQAERRNQTPTETHKSSKPPSPSKESETEKKKKKKRKENKNAKMVRRALSLSLRRGSALDLGLDIESAVKSAGGDSAAVFASGAPVVRRPSRRESLPLSRHHQTMRRSSSVSTTSSARTRTNSASTGSLSSLVGGSDASLLDDELAVILDDDHDDVSGSNFNAGAAASGTGTRKPRAEAAWWTLGIEEGRKSSRNSSVGTACRESHGGTTEEKP